MVIVDFSILDCLWCGTNDKTFLCSSCGKRTCGDCLVYSLPDGTCKHEKFIPMVGNNWDTSCVPASLVQRHIKQARTQEEPCE